MGSHRRQPIDLRELQREALEAEMGFSSRRAPPPRAMAPPRAPAPRAAAQVDIHEVLKEQEFKAGPGCSNHFEIGRPCPGEPHGISDQYIVLDSFLKRPESDTSRGVFIWDFNVQGSTREDAVGVRDTVDNVIEVQMGPFSIQQLSEVPYELVNVVPGSGGRIGLVNNNSSGDPPSLAPGPAGIVPGSQYPAWLLTPKTTDPVPQVVRPWVHNPYSQLPYDGTFSIQLKEAGLQSYSGRGGVRYHFTYVASAPSQGSNPNMLAARPLSGEDWDRYTFTNPIKDFHGLTLVFRNPDTPISFLPDCYYGVPFEADVNNFLRFNIPGHQLNAGDRVFVSGFKSASIELDSYVNRAQGHVVAGDPNVFPRPLPGEPLVGNYLFTDPAVNLVDVLALFGAGARANVFVAKRRMFIPVRLRRVIKGLTNYISP